MKKVTQIAQLHKEENSIRVEGDLSFDTVNFLLKQSQTLFTGAGLRVDLSSVVHADSAGLALLCEWRRRYADIQFIHPGEQLKRIAALSKLEVLF